MTAALLYPFIIVAGILQALGNSMNAQLRGAVVNPWLAATVSFAPIVFVFATLFLMMPTPLPSLDTLGRMPWYAPLGGVAGAVAVFGGLAFINKVGAGPFNGLTLTANILTSLALDAFGLFGLQGGGFTLMPWLGGLLMAVGVAFIGHVTPDDGAETDAGHGLDPRLLYPFIIVAGALQAIGHHPSPNVQELVGDRVALVVGEEHAVASHSTGLPPVTMLMSSRPSEMVEGSGPARGDRGFQQAGLHGDEEAQAARQGGRAPRRSARPRRCRRRGPRAAGAAPGP